MNGARAQTHDLFGRNLHFVRLIDEDQQLSTAARLNCKVEHLPFMYLGLPLGGCPKKVAFWQPMIDKVHKKLDKWRHFNLSRGGRATLCKSVLSNLPTYYMSLFLMR